MNFKGVAVVSIVGKQNVGKTTLIKELIPKLKESGYRVGTFKYNIRKLKIDHEHKDTYKYFHSGADTVAITSHDQIAIMKRSEASPRIDGILENYFNDVNIVLVEGYRGEGVPRIRIVDLQEFDKAKNTLKDDELLLSTEALTRSSFPAREISRAFRFIEIIISRDKH